MTVYVNHSSGKNTEWHKSPMEFAPRNSEQAAFIVQRGGSDLSFLGSLWLAFWNNSQSKGTWNPVLMDKPELDQVFLVKIIL